MMQIYCRYVANILQIYYKYMLQIYYIYASNLLHICFIYTAYMLQIYFVYSISDINNDNNYLIAIIYHSIEEVLINYIYS